MQKPTKKKRYLITILNCSSFYKFAVVIQYFVRDCFSKGSSDIQHFNRV